jgi:phosphoribosylformimino-5-aminoimidazole carboxamide ribotide isomerase
MTARTDNGHDDKAEERAVEGPKSTMFTIFPAIDLRGGKVVRLKQGDPDRQTVYGDDPVAAAKRWADAGAVWLHVVNLDGAFGDAQGSAANRAALAAIASQTQLKLQFGGGIRALIDAQAAIDAGVDRVVIGTAAVERPELVRAVLDQFGAERLVVGLDSRDGMIVTRGWQQGTDVSAITAGEALRAQGVKHALYTEVARDGMLTGVAAEMTAALAQCTGLQVLASGGVRDMRDIEELALYAPRGISGVIVGRSLYEGTLQLSEALAYAAGIG